MAKQRETLMDRLMNEVISYGGLPVTRAFAYQHAMVCVRSDGITGQRAISLAQMFAFGPSHPAIDAEPLSYEQWSAITGEDFAERKAA